MFQNGSACFRLHVRHSAGVAAGGGRGERGGDGGGGCSNPGMLLVTPRGGKNSTWERSGHQNQRQRRFRWTEAATVQQVPAACGTGSESCPPIMGYLQTARVKCNFHVRAARPCAQKPSPSRDGIVKNVPLKKNNVF